MVKLGALLLAVAMVAGPVEATSPTPLPARLSVRVTVTTANIQKTLPPARARADIARAATSSSVVLLQEMWLRDARRYVPTGWAAWQSRGPVGCRGNAVAWRRSTWRPLRARAVELHDSVYGTSCAVVVVLRARGSRLVLPVVSTHMLPGVDQGGRPRPRPGRVGAYAAALRRAAQIAANVRAYRGRVVLGGDWNVDYLADRRVQDRRFPYANLHRELDTAWAKLPLTGPTHDTRRIDALWWSERTGLHPLTSRTIRRTWSDHNFVRVTWAASSG